jgi:hypothetical protein
MRGSRRDRLVLAGKICLVVSIASSAVFAISSGRLG